MYIDYFQLSQHIIPPTTPCTRSALKLSTTITLDDTNTCAVFKEADRYSDTSTDSRETEGVVEQADVETVYEPLEVGGASNEETEENWE